MTSRRRRTWHFELKKTIFLKKKTLLFSILSHNPDCDVPPIVTDLIAFLSEYSLGVEGLFRRSAEVANIKRLQERIDRGLPLF